MKKPIKVFAVSDIHDWHTWLWDHNEREVIQPDIDLVLIAGDVQDRCTNTTYLKVHQYLATLSNADLNNPKLDYVVDRIYDNVSLLELEFLLDEILTKRFPNAKMIIIPGNHDCWSADKVLVKNPNIMLVDTLKLVTINIRNTDINILCCPYITYDAMFRGKGKPEKPYKNRLISEIELHNQVQSLKDNGQLENVDILLSHVPPYSIFDQVNGTSSHIGSTSLLNITNALVPSIRYHIFGHNHITPSSYTSRINSETTFQKFYNVSCRSEATFLTDAFRIGMEFDYHPRPSVSQQTKFFHRWKFANSVLMSALTSSKIQSISLDESNKCPKCTYRYKIQIAGCPFCIDCLNHIVKTINPYNFKDKRFEFFESWYQAQQQLKNKKD